MKATLKQGLELLGYKSTCILSGLNGIADQVQEKFNGEIRISVQPKGFNQDSSLKTGYYVDFIQLKKGKKIIETLPMEDRKTCDIPLGSLVEDMVTGFKGILYSKVHYLNGCVKCEVVPKIDKKKGSNELLASQYFDCDTIKKVGVGIARKKPKKKAPGGPITLSLRY